MKNISNTKKQSKIYTVLAWLPEIEKPPENPKANLSLLGVPHGWQFRRAIKEKYICQGVSRGNSGVLFPLVFDDIIIPHVNVSKCINFLKFENFLKL